ncbi:MAG: VOC family protein [Actinomycetota bacterium]
MYSIDHVVLAVSDLDRAGERLRREHGLASVPGGVHPRWGTGNRIVPLGDDYLELLAVVDLEIGRSTAPGRALLEMTSDGRDRWLSVCLLADDIESVAARTDLSVQPGSRLTPDGSELRWRGAGFDDDAREPWLPFFIAWDVPSAMHPGRLPVRHDVEVTGIAGVHLVGDAARLRAWLGPEGDPLPIDVVEGEPGVRAVALSVADGTTLRL